MDNEHPFNYLASMKDQFRCLVRVARDTPALICDTVNFLDKNNFSNKRAVISRPRTALYQTLRGCILSKRLQAAPAGASY